MDKWISVILGANSRLTCGKRGGGTLPLTTIFSQPIWGEEEGREKEGSFRVRSSHFSLDFPAIGSANSGEARSKVGLHCKGYVWVPGLWSFDNPER